MKYAKQANQPEFFQDKNPLHFCATAGSHPKNEWYAFDSVEDAIETISRFESQSFIDRMAIFEGELHYLDDLEIDLEGEFTGVKNYSPKNNFQFAIQLESAF